MTDKKQSKAVKPTEGEIATALRNPFEPVFNRTLRPKDATLATRGGSSGIWIYDEIERDCHAFAVIQKRKFSVVANEWHINAASDDPADQRAADRADKILSRLPMDQIAVDLLDAILKGYAVSEIVWDVVDGDIAPVAILPRDQRRFVFDIEGKPRLLDWSNMITGVELPERKFIVHRFGAKDGNPYGLGLGTRLFWPVWFKRQSIQFWLVFADKFGNPTPVGTYPSGASEKQKNDLLATLAAIANDTGIAIPEGMKIDLLEASRSGGGSGVYDELLKYLDDEIEKAVLGTTQTTSSRSGGLGSQVSAVQNEVRLELVRADADMLAGTLNATLLTWIAQFNDPDATPPQIAWDVKENEDLMIRAQRDQILSQLGYQLTPEAVRDVYGDFYTQASPTSTAIQTAAARSKTSAHGADPHAPPTVTDLQAQRLDTEAMGDMDAWIKPIRDLVERADSLEEVRDGLLQLYPQLPPARFAQVMEQALIAADLAGRYDILEQAGGRG
ncbi:MAG: DUF935 family protein [Sinobacteraceae bacterium]|nr:DUF935 family protein [Nevskiaceae bacterium]